MANIKIYGDLDSGSIFFINSTVDPKSLGTVVASLIDFNGQDRILVERNDRFQEDGVSFRVLFKKLNPNRVCNQQGEELTTQLGYSTQQVVDYINGQSNLTGANGGDGNGTDVTGTAIDFKLDATSTSIMLDNGFSYGVNTIKAISDADGTIHIISELGDLTYFTKLDHANVSINGVSAVGGLLDVVNALNELFQVGAFEQVVITDPYSTMVADVNGVDTTITLGGNAIDPTGNDVAGSTASGYNNSGILTTETINQAGEYFTFDIRGEGTIGMGLVLTDVNDVNGSTTYGDPATWLNGVNSGHYGYQFSHWFHPTPDGSWTNYGANTGYSMRSGWSGFPNKQNWLDGNPIKMRVGLDENGYISIDSYDPTTSLFVPHSRSSYVIAEGVSFKLGIKFGDTNARLYSLPKIHELEDLAPTMYFRYIESPDNNFEYPLFATEEEANYYDENNGGTGTSHTHTYTDDPTNTTWYMSDNGGTMTGTSAPTGQTFLGNAVTYTEITSYTNADLTPSAFSSLDYMYEEGTAVNLQLLPAGATWTQSVSISPAGSGLVYNTSNGLLQGTLADVTVDTTYTVTVTRANSYGSSVGTFEIVSTDETPVSTNDTSWDKALDFNGSNEHAKQVSSSLYIQPLQMGGLANTVGMGTRSQGETSNHSSSRAWAVACVFKSDGYNSNQMIFNQGEGSSTGNDNIFVNVGSTGHVNFGWGREGTGYNMCRIANNISSSNWYGICIASSGERLSGNNASASNLADCFDIRLMSSADGFASVSSNLSTAANWTSTGIRMDRTVAGDFTIGGRGNGYSFRGKVASMIVTTLITEGNYNSAQYPAGYMPDADQMKLMITDPVKWVADYKVRYASENPNGIFRKPAERYATNPFLTGSSTGGYQSTFVWLMGDGTSDSYSNGVRNYVNPADQNFSKLQLNSMVSNDIETVSINGLS